MRMLDPNWPRQPIQRWPSPWLPSPIPEPSRTAASLARDSTSTTTNVLESGERNTEKPERF
ncbi:MAG: hypothetical protein H6686_04580 [Fibrobacteria bacterium]|nr:hypothetical protein [Fibrobacteria bacterium]